MGNVRNGREQRRIHQRSAETQQAHRQQPDAEPAAQYDEQDAHRLNPHPRDDHALTTDPI